MEQISTNRSDDLIIAQPVGFPDHECTQTPLQIPVRHIRASLITYIATCTDISPRRVMLAIALPFYREPTNSVCVGRYTDRHQPSLRSVRNLSRKRENNKAFPLLRRPPTSHRCPRFPICRHGYHLYLYIEIWLSNHDAIPTWC